MHPLSKMLRCVSPRYGIINHLMRIPNISGDPRLASYGVKSADLRALSGAAYSPIGAGCRPDRAGAFMAAIGETVERYCSAFANREECIYGPYSKLRERYRMAEPAAFSLFHEEQFRHPYFSSVITPFTDHTEVTWTKAFNLTIGAPEYVPAQCIYLPFTRDAHLITIGVSTGLSAHSTFYEAVLSGLYEAVERDAITIAWLQGLSQRKVKITPWLQQYIEGLYPTKYEWHLFDITTDIQLPTIFGFCTGYAEYGDFVAVGAATRATYGEALRKTIVEIGQSIQNFRYILTERSSQGSALLDCNELNSFDDHSYFYLVSPRSREMLGEWIASKPIATIPLEKEPAYTDVKAEVRAAVKKVSAAGCDVLVKDLTTVDARQLGLYVVKVYSPQLVPLSGAYRFYFKGGSRLYDVPAKIGYTAKDYEGLTPFPHPFP